MGSIYHAVQEPIGRDVAVKTLKPFDGDLAKQRERNERFFREAAHTGRLNHPNTVTLFDYGELDSGGLFLVMEYLDGMSLREVMVHEGALDVKRALHVASQIASSLSDAHRSDVIHRDLKPPNIMLVKRGDDKSFVKVVDFGLVKQLDGEDADLTKENSLVGSPMYMAPERILYHNAETTAVDVYALGIILYEMLVGRTPFDRVDEVGDLNMVMLHQVKTIPPVMGKFEPELRLPVGLESAIMTCLAKAPEDRIESMEILLEILRQCEAIPSDEWVPVQPYLPENDEELPDTTPFERSLPERTGESFDALKYDKIAADFFDDDAGRSQDEIEPTEKLAPDQLDEILGTFKSQEMPVRVAPNEDVDDAAELETAKYVPPSELAEPRPLLSEQHTSITKSDDSNLWLVFGTIGIIVTVLALGYALSMFF